MYCITVVIDIIMAIRLYSYQRIDTGTRGLGNKSGNHPNERFIKIGQNPEKSPGDLKTLAVTQTPVRNHRLILVWKPRKWIIIIIIIIDQRRRKLMTMHKARNDVADYMCQEKKEEEDLPALKIASMRGGRH